MAEVVRIVADLGNTEVQPGVPDVMTGLPTGSAPAAAIPRRRLPTRRWASSRFSGGVPVDDEGVFFAVEGRQATT